MITAVNFSLIVLILIGCQALSGNAQNNPCAGKIAGIVPYPESCDRYIVCAFYIPITIFCNENEFFDEELLKCVEGDQENCEPWTNETTEESNATEWSTPEFNITEGTTLEWNATEWTTPEWNVTEWTTPELNITEWTTPELNITEWTTPEWNATEWTTPEWNVTEWTTPEFNVTEEISTPEYPTQAPPPNLNEICEGVFFGARAYPNSVSIFVGCIRGNGVLFQCRENEEFDSVLQECVEIIQITTQSTTTTEEPTTTRSIITTTPPNLEDLCEDKDNEVVPHPDCSLFIYCFIGKPFVRQCSDGTIFNAESLQCEPGDYQTCELTPNF